MMARSSRQGTLEAGVHWMHWPNLGAFAFAPGAEFVTAFPLPGVPVELIEEIYERGVLPMALQALGLEALHASGLLLPQGVLGLFATSETGKSTFAYELAKRGHTLWADDSILFDTGATDPTSSRDSVSRASDMDLPDSLYRNRPFEQRLSRTARRFLRCAS